MLAGEAVVAIWNGIAPEARAAFYDWHQTEHMPERVGIPGFRRGRRYVAVDAQTHPEFFTLYEADALPVLQGSDYANRLNAPTPWTRTVTAQFRDTARALARVLDSAGPGAGGTILTARFGIDGEAGAGASATDRLRAAVRAVAALPRITGAHLCVADDAASAVRTTETTGRADIQAPPTWFALVEATDPAALAAVLTGAELEAAGACGPYLRGMYRLEYQRGKTAFG